MDKITECKKAAAELAVDKWIKNGQKIGLGTGSTAVWAVRRIAELLDQGKLQNIRAVATSSQVELECQKLGIELYSLNSPKLRGELDVVIDGADQIDPKGYITKGGGAALLLEKIIAYSAQKLIITADESKLCQRLGQSFALPLEILASARESVFRALEKLGAEFQVREAVKKMGAVITDNGNMIVDITFAEAFDPKEMETRLNQIPGVLENGLFTFKKPLFFIGNNDGSVREWEAL